LAAGLYKFLHTVYESGNTAVIDSLTFIAFLFIGHSNMGGFCAEMDTVKNPHVWIIKDDKYINCTDKDFPRTTGTSGSVVMPFLKAMALRYPKYNFVGERYANPCNQAWHLLTEEHHRTHLEKTIKMLREKSTIGGVGLMEGFIEGQHEEEVKRIDVKIVELIDWLRGQSGNIDLPIMLGRYEKYGDKKSCMQYHQWDSLIIAKMETIPLHRKNVVLVPVRYVPAERYCDNHHYDADGYQIWGEDAAVLYQENHFDFWNWGKCK
jgi:hypothetical protein